MAEKPKSQKKMRKVSVLAEDTLRRSTRKVAKKLQNSPKVLFSYEDTIELMPQLSPTQSPTQQTRAVPLTPQSVNVRAPDEAGTPRRSGRKSIMPHLDYEEVIEKRIIDSEIDEDAPKWTPSKVGRISEKRARKSRKQKQKEVETENAQSDTDQPDSEEPAKTGDFSGVKIDAVDALELGLSTLTDEKVVDHKTNQVETAVSNSDTDQSESEEAAKTGVFTGVETDAVEAPELGLSTLTDENVVDHKANQVETAVSNSDTDEPESEEAAKTGVFTGIETVAVASLELGLSTLTDENVVDHKANQMETAVSNSNTDQPESEEPVKTSVFTDVETDAVATLELGLTDENIANHEANEEMRAKSHGDTVQPESEVIAKSGDFSAVKITAVEAHELGFEMLSDENDADLKASPAKTAVSNNGADQPESEKTGKSGIQNDAVEAIELDSKALTDEVAANHNESMPSIICVDDDEVENMANHKVNQVDTAVSNNAAKPPKPEETNKTGDFPGFKINVVEALELGLQMLTDEDDAKQNESMSSIISVDDNEDEDVANSNIIELNSTFCIEESDVEATIEPIAEPSTGELNVKPAAISSSAKQKTQQKTVRIQENTELQGVSTPSSGKTSMQSAKYSRLPTPYKPKKIVVDNPVLLSSSRKRKRSKSLSIDEDAAAKQRKNLRFDSAENRTVYIESIDEIIKKRVRKNKDEQQTNYVTQRRKRSLSCEDLTLLLPKPVAKKMPDFAAMHKKQFERMENVVQHVERKAERAKRLIESGSKLRLASAQKNASKSPGKGRTDLPKPRLPFVNQNRPITPGKQLPQHTPGKQLRLTPGKQLKPHVDTAQVNKTLFTFGAEKSPHKSTVANTSYAFGSTIKSVPKTSHMDLYKKTTRSANTVQKREEYIRGVRSNRRFDLLMKQRQNLEN